MNHSLSFLFASLARVIASMSFCSPTSSFSNSAWFGFLHDAAMSSSSRRSLNSCSTRPTCEPPKSPMNGASRSIEHPTYHFDDRRAREALRELDERLHLALENLLVIRDHAPRILRWGSRLRRGWWGRDGGRLGVRRGGRGDRGRSLRGGREIGRRERCEVLEPGGRRLEPAPPQLMVVTERLRLRTGSERETHLLMMVASECSPPDAMVGAGCDCVVVVLDLESNRLLSARDGVRLRASTEDGGRGGGRDRN